MRYGDHDKLPALRAFANGAAVEMDALREDCINVLTIVQVYGRRYTRLQNAHLQIRRALIDFGQQHVARHLPTEALRLHGMGIADAVNRFSEVLRHAEEWASRNSERWEGDDYADE